MPNKQPRPAAVPLKVLCGRLLVEEDPSPKQVPPHTIDLCIGLQPDGSRYRAIATLDGTIHVITELRGVRSVSLSSLVEAIVTARPDKPTRRASEGHSAKPGPNGRP